MKIRIIIGNHHLITRRRLEHIIAKEQELEMIGSCENGALLYSQITKRCPDLVILNPTMPGMDSIRLIEMVRREPDYDTVKFLLLGTGGQKKLLELLENKANVCFINYENSDETIVKAIYQTARQRASGKSQLSFKAFPDENTSDNLQLIVTDMMHSLGIPAHIKGYMYLRNALMMAVENMEILSAVTKQLYPDIAAMYNTTPSRVERAIRHAIEIAWNRNAEGTMQMLFGYGQGRQEEQAEEAIRKTKPTNSEFIALLADKIRLEVLRDAS